MLTRLPMVWFAACFAAGILAARFPACPWWLGCCCLGAGIALLGCLLARFISGAAVNPPARSGGGKSASMLRPRPGLLACMGTEYALLAFGIVLMGAGFTRQRHTLDFRAQALQKLPRYFTAKVVVNDPPEEALATDAPGPWRQATGVIVAINNKPTHPIPVRIMGNGPRDFPRGSVLCGPVIAEQPRPPAFPGAFDYSRFLETRGLVTAIRFTANRSKRANARTGKPRPAPYSITLPHGFHLRSWFDRVRARAVRRILSGLPGQSGCFLAAAVFGYKVGLDRDLRSAFQQVGIGHVLAISGLHVGLVAMIFWWLSGLVFTDNRNQAMISIPLCLIYLALSGMRIPATRATVMLVIYLAGFILMRRGNFLNSLGAAAILLLGLTPAVIVDLGFHLSFAAVLFISRLGTDLNRALGSSETTACKPAISGATSPPTPPPTPGKRLAGYLRGLIALSIAAWLGVTPLVAMTFHMVNPIGLIANIVALPVMTLVLTGGIIIEVAAAISPGIVEHIAPIAASPAGFLIGFANMLGKLPLGSIRVTPPPPWVAILYYALFVLWFMRKTLGNSLPARVVRRLVIPGCIIATAAFMVKCMLPAAPPRHAAITLMTSRAGDTVIIETPHGRIAVVGRITRKGADILRFLESRGQRRIDHLLAFTASGKPPSMSAIAEFTDLRTTASLATRLHPKSTANESSPSVPLPAKCGRRLAETPLPRPAVTWQQLPGMRAVELATSHDRRGKLAWWAVRCDGLAITVVNWCWYSQLAYRLRRRTPGYESPVIFLRVKLAEEELRAAGRITAKWIFLGHSIPPGNTRPGIFARNRFGAVSLTRSDRGTLRVLAYDGNTWKELPAVVKSCATTEILP